MIRRCCVFLWVCGSVVCCATGWGLEEARTLEPMGETVQGDFTREFARPVTNLNFNHPFIWNEFRPVFIHQEFPDNSALAGGNARIYAAQIWLKLTDRIQLIADKDGFVDLNPDALPDETG